MGEATRIALVEILAGEHRSDRNRARDEFRHPLETLAFFGLDKNMTVVEVWPGGGWYSELLAPLLRDSGKYYAAHWAVDSPRPYVTRALENYSKKLNSDPARYDQATVTHIGLPAAWHPVPPGTADMILSFRSVHNWMDDGSAAEIFVALHEALKPGGILGIVQHRGDPTVAQDPKAGTGYVSEAWLSALAKSAGFELVASSQVNANPKDTKNYPEGVWTLPPSSRLKDTPQAAGYRAIGKSDRMTLKFIKPAS